MPKYDFSKVALQIFDLIDQFSPMYFAIDNIKYIQDLSVRNKLITKHVAFSILFEWLFSNWNLNLHIYYFMDQIIKIIHFSK